ncbi:cytolethal distending toxin subunit B family protein [Campylobacter upsaliensis]|nr:cytolethal distending toxin subunit B family protein [Campylobacter upsaliensis]
MKKIFILLLSLSFLWADLEKYNVGTWNLQGSSAASESKWSVSIRQLITGDNPLDVLMVQEAGVLPNSAMMTGRMVQPGGIPIHEYIWNLGSNSRPNSVYIYYSRIDVGSNRVNLAIVSRVQADEVFVLPPPTTASRPIIGIRIGNDAFFSIHALARGGNDAGAIITAVDTFFRDRPEINWMIAGDFNRPPDTLLRLVDFDVANHVNIVSPSSFTQVSGGTLDYAVTGNSNRRQPYIAPLLSAILMLANLRTHLVSDHFPVNFRKF